MRDRLMPEHDYQRHQRAGSITAKKNPPAIAVTCWGVLTVNTKNPIELTASTYYRHEYSASMNKLSYKEMVAILDRPDWREELFRRFVKQKPGPLPSENQLEKQRASSVIRSRNYRTRKNGRAE